MEHAPNLYEYFGLDPRENTTSLGVLLAGKDAQLAGHGLDEQADARRQVSAAYSILSDEHRRRLYDDALGLHLPLTWAQLHYLGDFGAWPDPALGWQGAASASSSARSSVSSAPQPAPVREPSPYIDPFAPQPAQYAAGHSSLDRRANAANPVFGAPTGVSNYAGMQARPSMGTRFALAAADVFTAFIGSGFLVALVAEHLTGLVYGFLVSLLMVAYHVVPEMLWGGSPAKLAAGYQVRDVETGGRLSPGQVLRRNWFRLVHMVPVVGTVVGPVAALVTLATIKPEDELRGAHDRLAGAEVVSKRLR